ncbi:lysostaphin resistance A-like protein [Bacteroidota bacterium]
MKASPKIVRWSLIAIGIALVVPFVSDKIGSLDRTGAVMSLVVEYRKLWLYGAVILGMCYFEKADWKSLGLNIPKPQRAVIGTVVGSFATLVILFGIGLFWRQQGELYLEEGNIYFLGQSIPAAAIRPSLLYLMLPNQVLSVAFPEELFSRGYVQTRLMMSWSPLIAIIGSSVLFALAHIETPQMLIHLVLTAPLLGIVFYWSRTIWSVVIVHYVGNLGALFVFKAILLS